MAAKKTPKRKKAARKPAKPSARKSTRAAAAGARKGGGVSLASVAPSLTVDDIRASLDWYTKVLGFTVAERWEVDGVVQGAGLKAGNVRFYIGQDDWKKGRDRRKGEGLRLYCETSQDLDALARAIVARGGKLDHGPVDQPWGSRDFGLTDPNGFKITIAAR